MAKCERATEIGIIVAWIFLNVFYDEITFYTYSRLGHETSFLANVNGMQRFLRPNYISDKKIYEFCKKLIV